MKLFKYSDDLKRLFLFRGLLSSREAANALKISQPTFSRIIASMQNEVLVLGSGRSTKYGLKRELPNLDSELPIFLVAEDGSVSHLADLKLIKPKGVFVSACDPELSSRFYNDIPYWLEDLRPTGFLGRLIPKKHPELGYPNNIRNWSGDTCLHYWSVFAWDLIGNLIIGERAFELYTNYKLKPPFLVNVSKRATIYQDIANDILSLGAAGSSAGGEQPKFLAAKLENNTAVFVKFSPEGEDEVHQRRRDLLICEHLSLESLRNFSINAAASELIFGDKRVFLELERFDRTTIGGRRGIISLHAIDSEFIGSGGSWREIAKKLWQRKIITEEMYKEIVFRYYFGLCIGNNDMHAGNISFYSRGTTLLGLSPVYDMLPMAFAPVNEQIIPARHEELPLMPADKVLWTKAIAVAIVFWNKVEGENKVSTKMRSIAAEWAKKLKMLSGLPPKTDF